ncbi:MAG: YabP/YqfC family sporulation protein [Oscillospiraceae bacterium]|nr:YabP/YqfC family sporulation protein [Oscillospiraceae bacterium]
MKEKRRKTVLDELEMGIRPPLQIWGDHTVYTENCGGILDLGEDYIRFLSGKLPVTVFGSGISVGEYGAGRLLVRGKFTSLEFG